MEAATLEKTSSHNITFPTSVLGAKWQLSEPNMRDVITLMQQNEIPELVARLLLNRGITSEKAFEFLEPSIKNSLPDPFHLLDMDKAADRLVKAVLKKENVVIFGDYDVDGATSSALLGRFFHSIGLKTKTYIPDRILEGYGLNTDALIKLKEHGADLVVTVDCGTVSFAPIEAAKKAGLDVIVVDHHMGAEELPPALAVINPNRIDETSQYRNLAAVGVAFLLAVAVRRRLREKGYFAASYVDEPDLRKLLDLVALGTICDVVPLTGLNRVYVARGLQIMAQRENKGLAALSDVAGMSSAPDVYHAGFILGPRINAGGRVGSSSLGFKLLSTHDTNEAMNIAMQLDKLNRERQAIELQVMEEALAQVEKSSQEKSIIFASSPDWHPGVVGIVASRIKEKFNKPAAIIAIEKGIGKASVRSIPGVDIGAAITVARQQGLISEGGGHPMAAGFTVDAKRIPTLHHFLNERIKKDVEENTSSKTLKLDGLLGVQSITPELAKSLQSAAPYGMGNREPRFAISNAMIVESSVVGENHVRCIISDGGPNAGKKSRIKAIAFRHVDTRLGKELLSGYGHTLHLAGKIKLDRWQGNERAELQIEDAAEVSP